MAKLPDKNTVDPLTLRCPRCGAEPGIACDMLDDEFELIHLERIEAAAAVKPPRKAKS
jgi:hypothetical protein